MATSRDILLGALLGYIDGLELDTNIGNELGLSDWKVIGTTLGSLNGLSLGTYDIIVIRSLEGSTKRIVKGKFEGLLLGT